MEQTVARGRCFIKHSPERLEPCGPTNDHKESTINLASVHDACLPRLSRDIHLV